MTTYRARLIRLLIKHSFGRRFGKAGRSVTELRKLDDLLVRYQRPPRGTQVSSVSINDLRAEWVEAPGAASDCVVLYLHGGGFVMGSPDASRELAGRISKAGGFRVLSPAYRLAPEHAFPAALDDTITAYRWLLDQGHAPSQLVLGGESSGAGLALQALLSMKEGGIPLPRAAFFISPVTDWVAFDGDSYSTRASLDPLITLAQNQYTSSFYVGPNPKETPLFQPFKMNLAGLPPLWIQAGDREVLLSDAKRLARRAAAAGVEVDFKVWPGMWHVFQGAARIVPEARDSIQELGRFLRENSTRK